MSISRLLLVDQGTMVAGPVFNIVGRVFLSWDVCGILE